MDDRRRMESVSLIAFKVPTPLKSRLQLMATRWTQGVNLSQLLRHQCDGLIGLPEEQRGPANLMSGGKLPDAADRGWLSFWR